MTRLDELLTQASERFEASGIERNEATVLGFVMTYCRYRPGDEFYLCTLIHADLADREARREGFASQADRAARRAVAVI